MKNDEMTICQVCEYLAAMIDDKEQLEAINYIETKAKHLCETLSKRNDEIKVLSSKLSTENRKRGKLDRTLFFELREKWNIRDTRDFYLNELIKYKEAFKRACEKLEESKWRSSHDKHYIAKEEWEKRCLYNNVASTLQVELVRECNQPQEKCATFYVKIFGDNIEETIEVVNDDETN